MGSCASVSSVQQKSDVIIRKVKVSSLRQKQRDDQKKQRSAKDRLYIGEERNADIFLDSYLTQSHLMQILQRKVTTFLGTQVFDSRTQRGFQPMLKNLVLDHQEQFPKWLIDDEQFRTDQMQEFLQKCQETAKFQSQEDENDEDEDDDDYDEDDDEDQSDDNSTRQRNKRDFKRNSNGRQKIPKINTMMNKQNDEQSEEDDEDNSMSQSEEEEGKLLSSKNSQNQLANNGGNRRVSNHSRKSKQMFTQARSLLEEKSQISKRSAVEDSDEDQNSHDGDDENNPKKQDMHKVQEIQGMRRPSNQNNIQLLQKHLVDEENLKGSAHSSQVGGNHQRKRQSTDMQSMQFQNEQSRRSSRPTMSKLARPSNGNNVYVIKEFVIVKNEWVHTAICKSEIKTAKSLLEFKRRYFYEFDKMSAFLSYLLALKRMNFTNLLTFSYIQIGEAQYNGDMLKSNKKKSAMLSGSDQKNGKQDMLASLKKKQSVHHDDDDEDEDSRLVMYIDRIFPECGKTLEEYIHSMNPNDDILKVCTRGFQVFDSIANTLCKMHRAGFSYRVLRPSMIRIVQAKGTIFVYLDSPDFTWSEAECDYLSKRITNEIDFMYYDCKCLSALMIYYFLTIQDMRNRRRDSHRINPNLIPQFPGSVASNPNSMFDMHGTLKNLTSNQGSINSLPLIPNPVNFAELVAMEDQQELDTILEKIKLPQVAMETLQQLIVLDLHQQKPIEEYSVRLQGVLEKGPQTAFKHDSLSAFISYHGGRVLKNDNMHVYFRRKNQVHFYEFESKTFKVIKLIRKKAKFPVRTHLTFSHYDNCFYFFAAPNSNKVVKIPLNTNSKERHVINQKSEVIFFKSIKNMQIEEPQILTVIPDDYSFQLYIFNSRKNTDPDTNDVYYNSFIISVTYQQDEFKQDDWKESLKIYEGPRNYLWRRKAFHFFDPHNKFIYCILDSNNIFEKGIRFSYFDTSIQKGDFKDGNLRFACSTEDVFNQFCDLNMHILQIEFCVEVQHGVFLLQASKNIYILDFNYKCFYSFSTLKQLNNYETNNSKHPHRHQYAYEILNQPFEVKFNNSLNLGKNVVFQEGMLHILGRKEVETVICSYELLPTQGVMILKKCVSLHSFDDILLKIPKQLFDIWNFQEFKRLVYEKSAGVGDDKQGNQSLQSNQLNQLRSQQTLLKVNNVLQIENNTVTAKNVASIQSPTPQAQKGVSIQKLKSPNNAGGVEKFSSFNNQNNTLTIGNNNTNLLAPSPFGGSARNGQPGGGGNFLTVGGNNPLELKITTPMSTTNRSGRGVSLANSGNGASSNTNNPALLSDQQNNQISKIEEQKLNQFMMKINYINSIPSSLDGASGSEGGFHENQFKVLSQIQQTPEYTLYRILHQSSAYNLRKVNIGSIQEYEQFVQLLELNAQSKYLMQIKQCFLMQDDNTFALYVCLIEEDSEWSLLDEIKKRRAEQMPFKSQEIGTLLKAIFKPIISLQSITLVHGNVSPRLIYFTSKGFIRLAGWYLENRENFQNDFIDACSLVYQLVTLDYDEKFTLTPQYLQSNQEKLKNYPGLFSFLLNNLLILYDGDNLKLDQISEDIKEVYQSLQVHPLKMNKDILSSQNKRIFWIGYGSNYLISCHYDELSFCKNEVIYHNNTQYKFSKHNMFTFDHDRTMYMSGALKEDFKTQSQLFYSMDFSFIHQTKVKLRQLKDIPNSILQPSLLYCNEYVYCIGGYQIKFDGSKSISKKAYRYSIKTEDWEQISDMPIGVVSATLIPGKDNIYLYVFGGVSEEVELRGKELNYIVYDIEFDEWSLKVDLAAKSPFVNNRYIKPSIDHIGNNIFISMQRTHDHIFIQFFELQKGGINIKFKIEDERDDLMKEQQAEIDIFNEMKYQDYFKAYQDDLSLIFVNDTAYVLDEFSNALLTINFTNFNNIKYERTPCGIIALDKNPAIDKQLSLDRNTSIDSFYFNGY